MPAKSPATADDKGLKRICPSCGTRYYDFGKRPVVCPNCATEFTGEIKLKARRGRVAAVADDEEETNAPETARKKSDDETEEVETDEDTVSLDDVETMESGGDDAEETLDEDLDEDLADDDLDEDEDEADDLVVDDDKDL